MASPQAGNVLQQYSCRCHNITISAYDSDSIALASEPHHRVFVGEDGIHINHHSLTLRTRDRAQELQTSPKKLLQHLSLSCLACKTPTYRVAQEISRRNEAREGPVIPTEDWVEKETLLSKSGWIEVFVGPGGCLVGNNAIEEHMKSLQLSRTFSIGIISSSDTPNSPSMESTFTSQPSLHSSTDISSTKPDPLHTPLLPPLPPLFPPPPFTPSHPVFLSLATFATAKSTHLRQQAEEETRAFAKAKLDALENEEALLRKELEGIWRAYREGWKEVLGRVNEERRHSLPDSSISTSSAKSGVPMSIRDFSPIARSHSQVEKLPRTIMSPSTSLLSASRIQTGSHIPTLTRSPVPEAVMPESAAQNSNSGAHGTSTVISSRANGTHYSVSSPSSSPKSHEDVHYPGAFKRNMDTDVDIARSMAWLQGQEELRRRYGGEEDDEPKDRARKRTSKNLGIGAVEVKSASPTGQTGLASIGNTHTHSSSPDDHAELRQKDSGSTSKAKRRVTFNVHPEEPIINKTASKQRNEPDAEVELFDLDDLPWGEDNQGSDAASSKALQPQAVVRTASYKLRPNEGNSASHPASLPAHHPQSRTNGNTNWGSGSARRSIVLADALPLLSSSVPASDRILTRRSQLETLTHEKQPALTSETSSPGSNEKVASPTREVRVSSPVAPLSTIEYAEAELKTLLAASAPSHRHAWKEGGRAWEMFHQRARDKNKKVKGAISEEGSDRTSSGLDEDSDASSGESLTNSNWHNPSQYASSLPVQIRPLAQYKPQLQAKTSLTDKHGVLVPPLKVTHSRLNSAAAIRRAAYAERDRTRSIDPGPALDFNEQEEIEDEDASDISDGERGRHHALSILQARSIIPEAGMWRSMTS